MPPTSSRSAWLGTATSVRSVSAIWVITAVRRPTGPLMPRLI